MSLYHKSLFVNTPGKEMVGKKKTAIAPLEIGEAHGGEGQNTEGFSDIGKRTAVLYQLICCLTNMQRLSESHYAEMRA